MKKSLRLSKEEIDVIKNLINKNFGNSEIFIFGSQTNLKKLGGDIDIYVITPNKIDLKTKLLTKIEIEDKLLKKVDIIISTNKNNPIEKEAIKGVKI